MKIGVSFSWLPNSPRLRCSSQLTPFVVPLLSWVSLFPPSKLAVNVRTLPCTGKTSWDLLPPDEPTVQQSGCGTEKLSCCSALKSWFLTRSWAHRKRQGRDGMEPVCPLREPFGGDHTVPESHLTYTQPTVETTASPVLLWGGLVHAAIVQNRVHYFQFNICIDMFHFIMNI